MKQIFLAAFDLVRNPAIWIQKNYAIDDQGYPIHPIMEDACKFCSAGAIRKFNQGETRDAAYALYQIMTAWFDTRKGMSLIRFNDIKSHPEVIDAWIEYGKYKKYLPQDFSYNPQQ
jgi:hypothetical protein